MSFGVILIVIIFIGAIIYNTNNSNRKYQQPNNSIQSQRNSAVNDVNKAKIEMVRTFENYVETGFKETLNKSVSSLPRSATDVNSQMAHIRLKLLEFKKSTLDNPIFTEVLTQQEIELIIAKVNKRVLSDIKNHLR
jgi:methylthioribose-1-phosphate isomerase